MKGPCRECSAVIAEAAIWCPRCGQPDPVRPVLVSASSAVENPDSPSTRIGWCYVALAVIGAAAAAAGRVG